KSTVSGTAKRCLLWAGERTVVFSTADSMAGMADMGGEAGGGDGDWAEVLAGMPCCSLFFVAECGCLVGSGEYLNGGTLMDNLEAAARVTRTVDGSTGGVDEEEEVASMSMTLFADGVLKCFDAVTLEAEADTSSTDLAGISTFANRA